MKLLLSWGFLPGFSFILALSAFSSSCSHSTDLSTIKDTVCFDSQVLPILSSNCAMPECHDQGTAREGLVLSDYNSIMKAVSPGSSKNSRIYKAVTDSWGGLMPPPPRHALTLEQRTTLKLWIDQGAKETKCY